MKLKYEPMDSDLVHALRAGGPDANGQPAERGAISEGHGTPCRHCLNHVPAGAEYLILAHRPFPELQPYAECGPIFLCAEDCKAFEGEGVPAILSGSLDFLVKGYSVDYRIVYGTGKVAANGEIASYATELLSRADIAFVDVRSARNNCFQLRIRCAA